GRWSRRAKPVNGLIASGLTFLSFFFSSRRRHTRWPRDWSSDVCSSDLLAFDRKEPATGRGNQAARGQFFEPSLRIYVTPVLQRRSEERRVGKECRSRWSRDH